MISKGSRTDFMPPKNAPSQLRFHFSGEDSVNDDSDTSQ